MAIPTWVDTAQFNAGDEDITAYGRDVVGWTVMRGTSSIVQTGFVAQAGTYSQTLNNLDRRFDPNFTSGPHFGDLVPNVGFDKHVTYAPTTYPFFVGAIDDWPQSYPSIGVDQVSQIQAFDAIKKMAEGAQVSLTRHSEYTGARISAVLTALGLSTGDIAHGNAIVAPIKKSQGSITAWSHITDCVNAEWGDIYVDRSGNIVFRDRTQIILSASSSATYSDTTTLKYADITMAALPIVNDCTVGYGTRGRTVHFSNSASVTSYGLRSLTANTILNERSAAKQYAHWIVSRYKDPITVPASITIKPGGNPTVYFPEILDRELGDVITVVRTPTSGGELSDPITNDVFIRGIQHTYSGHVWQSTTYYLQDASWVPGFFILGTSVLGGTDVLGL